MPRLWVIDGSKALRSAIEQLCGEAARVQRCRIHKIRNVTERLPKAKAAQTRWVMTQVLKGDADTDIRKLKAHAKHLKAQHPDAAASLLEGLDELFTINRLGVTGELARCLATTNVIESPNSVVRRVSGRVTRYRDAQMAMRLPRRRRTRTAPFEHWLAVLDIDHFKRVNDNYGHLIGDEMLLLLATLMKASFRNHDKLYRFGGEEFVALLKPTEEHNAHAAFERFRAIVEAFQFPQAGRLTISIGYVRIGQVDQPSLVLEHADAALYWAKEHGRNRAVQYDATVAVESPMRAEKRADVEFF